MHNRHERIQDQTKTGFNFAERFKQRTQLIRQYKFVLAFENTDAVPNYVTEKVWNSLLSDVVPVYWGHTESARDEFPPGSVIFAADFASPRELALHLLKVGSNKKEYSKYFEWRRAPLSHRSTRLAIERCTLFAKCRICRKIAMEKYIHTNMM